MPWYLTQSVLANPLYYLLSVQRRAATTLLCTAYTQLVACRSLGFRKGSSIYVRGLVLPTVSIAIPWEITLRYPRPRERLGSGLAPKNLCCASSVEPTSWFALTLSFRRLQDSVCYSGGAPQLPEPTRKWKIRCVLFFSLLENGYRHGEP